MPIRLPEHFTASLVGHQSARSENKLTYGLYSAGISDTQKREIIDQVRLATVHARQPQQAVLSAHGSNDQYVAQPFLSALREYQS
jgi:hypothetical protein